MTDARPMSASLVGPAPEGMPDPALAPPQLARSGDPFAALRVVHFVSRLRRNESLQLRDVVAALNAEFLEAMRDQPWEVAWIQANAGRTRMIEEWWQLREPTDEAAWWIRKTGSEHYAEHLGRLREWCVELIERRTR